MAKRKRKRTRKVTKTLLRKVMKKAAYYRKRGMSQKRALKKAWRTVR